MARYSLSVLQVLLNTTNQTKHFDKFTTVFVLV